MLKKNLLIIICLLSLTIFIGKQTIHAQGANLNQDVGRPSLENVEIEVLDTQQLATQSAEEITTDATQETKLSSPSAQIEQKIQEKKDEDITETGGKRKSKLVAYIEQHPPGKLTWHNFLLHAVISSIEKGLPANILVLLILFPLITSLIAFSRHIIGLQGFGIYIPAVLSVAFVSTGIVTGSIIFIIVLLASNFTRTIIRKLKLPYLPRTAMILWGVSVVVLATLIISSQFNIFTLLTISIFPILIIILLTENFMESQLFNSQKEALRFTMETLFIAIVGSLIISQDSVQQFVILRPELTLLGTALINYFIGRYNGLRLLEYLRFNPILSNKNTDISVNVKDNSTEE